MQCCSKSQYPNRNLPFEHGSLLKSSVGSNREIQTSSKYHFYQRTNKRQTKFSFHFVSLQEALKEVALLSDKKASQASDIPVKIIKEN